VRLDLFGDTLESIRAFDPETQRSTRQLTAVSLLPVSEALLDKDAISRFRTGYVEPSARRATIRSTPRSARAAGGPGMEHWLPLFYERMATLFDYLPAGALVGVDHLAAEAATSGWR
jgi:transcription-repair coupling factor (superfamily II helicase)